MPVVPNGAVDIVDGKAFISDLNNELSASPLFALSPAADGITDDSAHFAELTAQRAAGRVTGKVDMGGKQFRVTGVPADKHWYFNGGWNVPGYLGENADVPMVFPARSTFDVDVRRLGTSNHTVEGWPQGDRISLVQGNGTGEGNELHYVITNGRQSHRGTTEPNDVLVYVSEDRGANFKLEPTMLPPSPGIVYDCWACGHIPRISGNSATAESSGQLYAFIRTVDASTGSGTDTRLFMRRAPEHRRNAELVITTTAGSANFVATGAIANSFNPVDWGVKVGDKVEFKGYDDTDGLDFSSVTLAVTGVGSESISFTHTAAATAGVTRQTVTGDGNLVFNPYNDGWDEVLFNGTDSFWTAVNAADGGVFTDHPIIFHGSTAWAGSGSGSIVVACHGNTTTGGIYVTRIDGVLRNARLIGAVQQATSEGGELSLARHSDGTFYLASRGDTAEPKVGYCIGTDFTQTVTTDLVPLSFRNANQSVAIDEDHGIVYKVCSETRDSRAGNTGPQKIPLTIAWATTDDWIANGASGLVHWKLYDLQFSESQGTTNSTLGLQAISYHDGVLHIAFCNEHPNTVGDSDGHITTYNARLAVGPDGPVGAKLEPSPGPYYHRPRTHWSIYDFDSRAGFRRNADIDTSAFKRAFASGETAIMVPDGHHQVYQIGEQLVCDTKDFRLFSESMLFADSRSIGGAIVFEGDRSGESLMKFTSFKPQIRGLNFSESEDSPIGANCVVIDMDMTGSATSAALNTDDGDGHVVWCKIVMSESGDQGGTAIYHLNRSPHVTGCVIARMETGVHVHWDETNAGAGTDHLQPYGWRGVRIENMRFHAMGTDGGCAKFTSANATDRIIAPIISGCMLDRGASFLRSEVPWKDGIIANNVGRRMTVDALNFTRDVDGLILNGNLIAGQDDGAVTPQVAYDFEGNVRGLVMNGCETRHFAAYGVRIQGEARDLTINGSWFDDIGQDAAGTRAALFFNDVLQASICTNVFSRMNEQCIRANSTSNIWFDVRAQDNTHDAKVFDGDFGGGAAQQINCDIQTDLTVNVKTADHTLVSGDTGEVIWMDPIGADPDASLTLTVAEGLGGSFWCVVRQDNSSDPNAVSPATPYTVTIAAQNSNVSINGVANGSATINVKNGKVFLTATAANTFIARGDVGTFT